MKIQVIASGSQANCYLVSDGTTTIMLECGYNWDNMLKNVFDCQIRGVVRGLLISHEHLDHARYWKHALQVGIDIYSSQGTFDALGAKDNHHLHTVQHNKQFQIGSFRIMPFSTEHDCEEPLGFLIYSSKTKEKLLFATDTYYIHWQFKDLNYIMIECNYQTEFLDENVENGSLHKALVPRLTESHMSLDTCLDFICNQDLSSVKQICLLHLSDGNSNAQECKDAIMAETGIPTIVAKGGVNFGVQH